MFDANVVADGLGVNGAQKIIVVGDDVAGHTSEENELGVCPPFLRVNP